MLLFLAIWLGCFTSLTCSAHAQNMPSQGLTPTLAQQSTGGLESIPDKENLPKLTIPEEQGLLNGLLSGTLIGSLLTNQPFTGVGIADALLLLLVVALLSRFRRGISPTTPQQLNTDIAHNPPHQPSPQDKLASPRPPVAVPGDDLNPHLYQQAANMWGHLQGNDAPPQTTKAPTRKRSEGFTDAPQATRDNQPITARDAYQAGEASVPAGFDTEEFLKGAKMVFARLQHSWDIRDMDDIAQFTTPEVHDEIKRQAAQDPTPSSSELLLVNARLMEVKQEENGLLVTVFFDVLMRESAANSRTEKVREIWHFLKNEEHAGMWRLDGIEHIAS